jgi:hypothetical protein
VRERKAVDVLLDLAQDPGRDALLDARDQRLLGNVDEPLDELQAELRADHSTHAQQLAGHLREARGPVGDQRLHALRHGQFGEGPRELLRAGVGGHGRAQVLHGLEHEQRVAVGLRL